MVYVSIREAFSTRQEAFASRSCGAKRSGIGCTVRLQEGDSTKKLAERICKGLRWKRVKMERGGVSIPPTNPTIEIMTLAKRKGSWKQLGGRISKRVKDRMGFLDLPVN